MNFEPNKILEQGQNKWVPAERATIEEMTLVARGDPTTNRSHRHIVYMKASQKKGTF